MTVRCSLLVVAVIVLVSAGSSVGAEELGFPKSCIELEKMPSNIGFNVISQRDSVQFSILLVNSRGKNFTPQSFMAWDLETGKWLAKRPAPDVAAHHWEFSPDGKLLAVPTFDKGNVIQLWEVGSKDLQGVPQLRLTAKLRHQIVLRDEQLCPADLRWTPDSKTLVVRWWFQGNPKPYHILFWSFTDKPSVWADLKQDEREPKSWKAWAKLEFDNDVRFAVAPDNRTLAVIQGRRERSNDGFHRERLIDGQFFDPHTAQLRETFKIDRLCKEYGTIHQPVFSPDSKTLAIFREEYFALWDTDPPAPRVETARPDFFKDWATCKRFVFTPDSRSLLTTTIAQREDSRHLTGGMLQVRDAQSGKVQREAGFPEKLGLLWSIDALPDGRVRTTFLSRSRKDSQVTNHREFLWHADDLLRYAAEHGSPPL